MKNKIIVSEWKKSFHGRITLFLSRCWLYLCGILVGVTLVDIVKRACSCLNDEMHCINSCIFIWCRKTAACAKSHQAVGEAVCLRGQKKTPTNCIWYFWPVLTPAWKRLFSYPFSYQPLPLLPHPIPPSHPPSWVNPGAQHSKPYHLALHPTFMHAPRPTYQWT